LKPSIEINSLTVSKLKDLQDEFVKYDIDVSIDEVENANFEGVQLKYKFGLVSIPTNARISIEGLVSLNGSESEISKQLEPDHKNIPTVVNQVYKEIYPLLYILTKSVQIPCPAYKLSQLSSAPQSNNKHESPTIPEPAELNDSTHFPIPREIEPERVKVPN
jgi:hypothetical protein